MKSATPFCVSARTLRARAVAILKIHPWLARRTRGNGQLSLAFNPALGAHQNGSRTGGPFRDLPGAGNQHDIDASFRGRLAVVPSHFRGWGSRVGRRLSQRAGLCGRCGVAEVSCCLRPGAPQLRGGVKRSTPRFAQYRGRRLRTAARACNADLASCIGRAMPNGEWGMRPRGPLNPDPGSR